MPAPSSCHFNIATEGVRSCNPCTIATLGMLGFDVQVEITPPEKYSPYYKPQTVDWQDYNDIVGDKYIVKITVTYKNRKWTIERLINEPLFDKMAVAARFLRVANPVVWVRASFSKILNTIKIYAKRKV